ncbi:MAG: sulfatase, partial [Anaerolineales bacterium]
MKSSKPSPNFVFIMTDTQATNAIGAYGRPELRTPNIDRLAQTGIKFDNAYTTCPLCTPARAGLFSGIYAHTSGPWTNNLPLGDNIISMGQRFRDNGYHTAYIGKWHLDGHDYFGTGQCPEGWDPAFWYDGKNYLDELTEAQITLWRQQLNTLDDLYNHNIKAEFTWAHRIGDRSLAFLQQQTDEPFVLVVSYDEPHHPFTAPPEYVAQFKDYDYP